MQRDIHNILQNIIFKYELYMDIMMNITQGLI